MKDDNEVKNEEIVENTGTSDNAPNIDSTVDNGVSNEAKDTGNDANAANGGNASNAGSENKAKNAVDNKKKEKTEHGKKDKKDKKSKKDKSDKKSNKTTKTTKTTKNSKNKDDKKTKDDKKSKETKKPEASKSSDKKSSESSNKKKIIAGVACIVVVAGVVSAVALYNNKSAETNSEAKAEANSTQAENVVQNDEQVKPDSTEQSGDLASVSKVDTSKPWVYNANYSDGKKSKTITNNTGKTYNSADELIVPYINIKSEYANYINSEIKNLFETNYNAFGGTNAEMEITEGYLPQISYEYAVSNNVLSVVITKGLGIVNGDASVEYDIYNFNLTTLNKASLSDLLKETGFETENELKECVETTITNEVNAGNLVREDIDLDYNLSYLDKNSLFNILVTSPAGGATPIIIRKGITENQTNTNSNTNMNSDTNVTTEVPKSKYETGSFYFYAPTSWDCKINETPNSTYHVDSGDEYYEISGKVNGQYKKAFSIVISKDTSYSQLSWQNIGKYSDGKYIYFFQNFVCTDYDGNNYTDADYKFEEEIHDAFASLNVKYMVMNEFGSADTMKTLEGKYFFHGEPGTSSKSFVYYINNGNLCRTDLSDGFPTEILANNVSKLYYNSSDHKIHATSESDNFVSDIISNDDSIEYDI